jgi:hypothetical protein
VPLNKPWIPPFASIVTENVPLIGTIVSSVICPDQLPVSDPWKALGGEAGVLVVGVGTSVVSVICPDQLPVSDPWKALGGGVGVLVVGVGSGVGGGGSEGVDGVVVGVVEGVVEGGVDVTGVVVGMAEDAVMSNRLAFSSGLQVRIPTITMINIRRTISRIANNFRLPFISKHSVPKRERNNKTSLLTKRYINNHLLSRTFRS